MSPNNGRHDDERVDMARIPRHGLCGPFVCHLIEQLKDGKPGDTVTAEHLNARCKAAGFSMEVWSHKGLAALRTARRYVCRHFKRVWEIVPGTLTLKCLEASEALESVRGDLKSVARKATRVGTKGRTIDVEKLGGQSSTLRAVMAQVDTIACVASAAATRAIETRPTAAPLDLKALVDNIAKAQE